MLRPHSHEYFENDRMLIDLFYLKFQNKSLFDTTVRFGLSCIRLGTGVLVK